jgi:hypothetical protein
VPSNNGPLTKCANARRHGLRGWSRCSKDALLLVVGAMGLFHPDNEVTVEERF